MFWLLLYLINQRIFIQVLDNQPFSMHFYLHQEQSNILCFPLEPSDESNQLLTPYLTNQQPTHAQQPIHTIKLILQQLAEQREELLEDVDIQGLFVDGGRLDMIKLLRYVQVEHYVMIEGREIMLFFGQGQIFINLGKFPLMQQLWLQVKEYTYQAMIIIKIKNIDINLIHWEMSKDPSTLMIQGPPKLIQEISQEQPTIKKKSSIKNFQKIGYIVRKVLSQKKQKSKRNTSKFLFQNERDRQLSKKSIQDYYYQLKLGHKYNFDFNENSSKNMKELRKFVRANEMLARRHKESKESDWTQFNNNKSLANRSTLDRSQTNLKPEQHDF